MNNFLRMMTLSGIFAAANYGSTLTWDFSSPAGKYNSPSHVFASTGAGVQITAYAFDYDGCGGCTLSPYSRNTAGDMGLGIAKHGSLSVNNEIDSSDYVQLDLQNVIALAKGAVQISMSSLEGDQYSVYGSNTLGQIGTKLTNASSLGSFSVPQWGTYKFLSIRGVECSDVLISTASLSYVGTLSTVPEPATYAMLGSALLFAGLFRRRKA